MKISFIGGGNMARAIISGLKKDGFDTTSIIVVEPNAEKRNQLSHEFSVQTTDNYVEINNTDVIVLAVKPHQLKALCTTISQTLVSEHLIISIAAGVRSADISKWLNGHQAIVRVMPNTPAQIQAGVSALYASDSVNQNQRAQATTVWQRWCG